MTLKERHDDSDERPGAVLAAALRRLHPSTSDGLAVSLLQRIGRSFSMVGWLLRQTPRHGRLGTSGMKMKASISRIVLTSKCSNSNSRTEYVP